MINSLIFLSEVAVCAVLYVLIGIFVQWAYTKVMLWHLGNSQSEISKHDLYEVKEDAFKYGVGWLMWLILGILLLFASPIILIFYGACVLYDFIQEQLNLN